MENKKFMLGDEPKSYPPSPPSQTAYRHEERTTSPLPSAVLRNTSTEPTHANNITSKRPTRHLAKRRSGGTRFMKRSTSMEDTTIKTRMRRLPSQQRLQSLSPMPIMTQLSSDSTNTSKHDDKDQQSPRPLSSRNDSSISTTSSRTAPSSFIVSSMECAKPIEQILHATAKSLSPRPPIDITSADSTDNNESPCPSATKVLRHVSASSSQLATTSNKRPHHHHHHHHHQRLQQSEDRDHHRPTLVSQFIQQQQPQPSNNNILDDDSAYQKMMDDQYRDLQPYHHPMMTSLKRCLANKVNHISKQTPPLLPESTYPPKSSSSSALLPATTSAYSLLLPTTGSHHQRHHSHSGDYETMGTRHLQQQQQQQQKQQQVRSIHADQRQTIHKNHMKKIHQSHDTMRHHHHSFGGQMPAHQQGPSIVSSEFVSPAKRSFALSMSSSSSTSASPWVTSIWDRVWNGLIKA